MHSRIEDSFDRGTNPYPADIPLNDTEFQRCGSPSQCAKLKPSRGPKTEGLELMAWARTATGVAGRPMPHRREIRELVATYARDSNGRESVVNGRASAL